MPSTATLFDPRAANLDLYGGVGLLAAAVGDRFGRHRAHHERRVRCPAPPSMPPRTSPTGSAPAPSPLGSSAGCARARDIRRPNRARAARARRPSCSTRRVRAPAAPCSTRIAGCGPAQLVYVACDPVAFARDVAILARARVRAHRRCVRSTCSRTRITSRRSALSRAERGRTMAHAGHDGRERGDSDGRAAMTSRHRGRVAVPCGSPSSTTTSRCDWGSRPPSSTRATTSCSPPPTWTSCIDGARGREVDVVVLDLSLGDGSTVTDNVKRGAGDGHPPCWCTASPTGSPLVREALAAGAAGVIPKSSPTPTVIAAAATVARGDVLNNLEWASAIDADRDFAKAQLGRREREILHLYASGLPLKLAAEQLGHRLLDGSRVPRPHPGEVRRGRTPGADEGRPAASRGRGRHPAGARPRRWRCPPLNGSCRGSCGAEPP